jgi:prepilin-type N-terminal cleavage/methylation domain-containing protein
VKTRRRGFTLIELLVVIAIIAILAAILFPVFARARASALKASDQSNQHQLGRAHMMYSDDYSERFCIRAWYHDLAGEPYPDTPIWIGMIHYYVKDKKVHGNPAAKGTVYGETWATRKKNSIGYNTNIYGWYMSGTQNYYPEGGVSYRKLVQPTRCVVLSDGVPEDPLDSSRDQYCRGYLADNREAAHACGVGSSGVPSNEATTSLGAYHNVGTVVCFADGHSKWYRTQQLLPTGEKAPSNCWQQAYVDINGAQVKWLIWDSCIQY